MAVMRGLVLLFLVLFVENAAACGNGWKFFETKCYKFFPETASWATAEQRCKDACGNLASVRSKAQNDFLMSLVPLDTHAWIGGHDGEEEKQWLWADGSQFDYVNWCSGEPNNVGGENCLEMNWTGNHCWNDASCSITMGYVCARKRI